MNINNPQPQLSNNEDEEILIVEEDEEIICDRENEEYSAKFASLKPWKILVVDDEPAVHQATNLAFRDYKFENRALELFHAYSGTEAIALLKKHSDFCSILLDVVMETKDAGLKVVEYIRDVLSNNRIQIILRTGQPGESPETDIIQNYEINDYKLKTELTRKRLITSITTAIRSYRNIVAIDSTTEKLRISEQRYSSLANTVPVGIFRTDVWGNYIYVNDRWSQITGIPEKAALGNGWQKKLHSEDYERITSEWKRSILEKLPFDVEYRCQNLDDGVIWVYGKSVPERDDNGEIVGYIGTIIDISDRKRVEKELEFNKFLVDNSAEAIIILDTNGKVIHGNPSSYKNNDYSEEEFCSLTIGDLSPETQEKWSIISYIVGKLKTFTLETNQQTKSGEIYPVEIVLNQLNYEGEEYIVAFIRDITERKITEKSLKLTQFAVDKAATGIFWIQEDGLIVDVNESTCSSLGLSHNQLTKMYVWDIDPNVEPSDWSGIWQDLINNTVLQFESTHQHKNGSIFPVEIISNYIEYEGQGFAFSQVQNISDRVATQRSLKLTQFAIENTAMGIFWINQDGRFIDVNQSGCINLDYSLDELKQLHVWEISPGFPPEAWFGHWQEIQTLTYKRFEAQHQTKDGKIYPVEITSNYLEYEGEGFIFAQAQNISERKLTENRLKESEQRFRRAIEDAPFPIAIHAEDGEILQINSTWTELTGYSHEEIPTTKVWLEKAYGTDTARVLKKIIAQNYNLTSSWEEGEFSIATKYGNKCLWQFSSAPLGELSDGRSLVISMAVDVTLRREAEKELYQSEQLLQLVLDTIPHLVFWKNRQSVYMGCNKAFAEIAGLDSPQDVKGKTDYDLPWKKEESDFFVEIDRRIMENNQAELRIVEPQLTATGEKTWIETSKVPLLNSNQQVIGILGTYQDITTQKEAEDTLKSINEKLEIMVCKRTKDLEQTNGALNRAKQKVEKANQYEQAIISIIRYISQSLNTNNIFTTITNEIRFILACDRVTVYKFKKNWSGKFIFESKIENLPTLTNIEWQDSYLQKYQGGKYQNGRVLIVNDIYNANLSECHLEVLEKFQIKSYLVVPIFIGKKLWGLLSAYTHFQLREWQSEEVRLFQQVTSHLGVALKQAKLLQRLTEEKEKADRANKAKSAFLANMSHELRTPLNGILGYAQILRQDKNYLTAKQRKGLNIIYKSGDHLLTLINDILDHAKIEAGKLKLLPTNFYLPNFLQDIVDMMSLQAQAKKINFQYIPISNLDFSIYTDEKRLRQIILNLMSNAIKFTDGGEVIFKVKTLAENNKNQVKKMLRFTIEDTGIGMSSEQLKQIFNPFEQVGNERRQAEGTGLGLNITKQLVEKMGGSLKVKSKLGKGSIFWFDITFSCSETLSKNDKKSKLIPIVNSDRDNQINKIKTNPKQTFVKLPPEEIEILYNLAMLGSMKKIKERALYLKKLDDKYTQLATQLIDLAEGFQEKEIVSSIEQYRLAMSNE